MYFYQELVPKMFSPEALSAILEALTNKPLCLIWPGIMHLDLRLGHKLPHFSNAPSIWSNPCPLEFCYFLAPYKADFLKSYVPYICIFPSFGR